MPIPTITSSELVTGRLDVLNCGAGHLTFAFRKNEREEVEKAKKVITDMLRRGYMLFIEVDGKQHRVRKFDPEIESYILEEPDLPEEESVPDLAVGHKPRGTPRSVPMRKARATGIGPTAGG